MSMLSPFKELKAICISWSKSAKWVFDGYDGYSERRNRDSTFKAHATRFEDTDTMLFIGYIARKDRKGQGICNRRL